MNEKEIQELVDALDSVYPQPTSFWWARKAEWIGGALSLGLITKDEHEALIDFYEIREAMAKEPNLF